MTIVLSYTHGTLSIDEIQLGLYNRCPGASTSIWVQERALHTGYGGGHLAPWPLVNISQGGWESCDTN